jgi:flagellar L-ring protein precursor FlgH
MMRLGFWCGLLIVAVTQAAQAADLSAAKDWSSLASDRIARSVGDSLTVVIDENSAGSGTAENSADKNTTLQGQISAGNSFLPSLNEGASLGVGHTADNTGTTTRSGSMVAEISAIVDSVLPNGDLHISGQQILNINGEKTTIRVQGRVRLADISASNAILSSNLADATIDYDGQGFVSQSSQPGLLTRALNWIGLP